MVLLIAGSSHTGKTLLALLADGTVLPCRRLPIEVGNLLNQSLLSIYNENEVLNDLRKDTIPEECRGCLKSSICKGGLKCLSYSLQGDYHLKDKDCLL